MFFWLSKFDSDRFIPETKTIVTFKILGCGKKHGLRKDQPYGKITVRISSRMPTLLNTVKIDRNIHACVPGKASVQHWGPPGRPREGRSQHLRNHILIQKTLEVDYSFIESHLNPKKLEVLRPNPAGLTQISGKVGLDPQVQNSGQIGSDWINPIMY